jgi:hypothetical protein
LTLEARTSEMWRIRSGYGSLAEVPSRARSAAVLSSPKGFDRITRPTMERNSRSELLRLCPFIVH